MELTEEQKRKLREKLRSGTLNLGTTEDIIKSSRSSDSSGDYSPEAMAGFDKYLTRDRNLIKEFDDKVKLDRLDWSFMVIALGLQVARQMLAQYITNNRAGHDTSGNLVKKSPLEVFAGKVPYDVSGGIYHRENTLGHDPILGLFFGTINIATDTVTYADLILSSNRINMAGLVKGEPVLFPVILGEAWQNFSSDIILLPTCLAKQVVHSSTDIFSKNSLPIPFSGFGNNELKRFMQVNKLDTFRLGTEVASFGLASLINYIVEFTYLGMKNSTDEQESKFNQVKAKNIVTIANILASSSNIVLTAMSGNLTKLDFGGITATLIHLFKSADFIENIKREFVTNNLFAMYDAELEEIKKRVDSYNIV